MLQRSLPWGYATREDHVKMCSSCDSSAAIPRRTQLHRSVMAAVMADTLTVKPYPAEIAAKPCVVAVTGCTGFVGGTVVARLLALGHTVHGTCRDVRRAQELQVCTPGWAY